VIPILEREAGKRADVDFGVCANPEFIREGSAVRDFFLPAFTVMGTREARSLGALRQIYGSLPGMVFETSIQTAEMVKYACNAFHALKIDFANEIASFARELGVDPNEVMDIVCADTKLNISRAYLRPGFAFGGSCLPKDVGALVHCARQHDLALPLLEALLPSNHAHINRAYESLLACGRKKVGFLGLSFKAGTDDLRESPALLLIKRLIGEGYVVRAYDRSISKSRIYGENKRFAETEIPHLFSILRPTMEEVVRESEVIVIANNDEEYSRTSTLLNPEQRIIDLVGLHRSSQPTTTLVPQQPATYQVRQQTA
jgi:GDP-mannose 6-dehydrogenase